MKKLFFIITLVIFSISGFSQTNFGTDDSKNYYTFGVRIIPNGASIGQFYMIYAPNDEIQDIYPISKDDFIRGMIGDKYYRTKANPNKENLLTKNGINSWQTINDLWKLRYFKYPYCVNCDSLAANYKADSTGNPPEFMGWTNNSSNPYMPAAGQMNILRSYGLASINQYIYGENLFRLLKDMENSNWVSAYRQAVNDND